MKSNVAKVSEPVTALPHGQWTDVIQYLTVDDFKALRLVGNKSMNLEDPSFTCHLQLRMDKAPFFSSANRFTDDETKKWLTYRRRLVINDAGPNICPRRLAYLVTNGFLVSVSQLVIFDCHAHNNIFALLAQLPNLGLLRLASHANGHDVEWEDGVQEELESIVANVGRIQSLKHLDIEFDCVIHGSHLSLTNLSGLNHLLLRGFNLSEGISQMAGLRDLTSLHLCHGNFLSSPMIDAREKDIAGLVCLTKLQHVHLEGFDGLSEVGFKAFSCLQHVHLEGFDGLSGVGFKAFSTTPTHVKSLVLKYCQDLSENCMPSIGRMQQLNSLHFINSEDCTVTIFYFELLQNLNALVELKSLSLFYVLDDLSDLRVLSQLTSLETLNIAIWEVDEEDIVYLCEEHLLPIFGSLQKLRVFSEDGISHSYRCGRIDVEYAPYEFGDIVNLE
ncbi:hypothetical protein ACHAXR_003479 [Thalassiosira sp. AJA248-18]